MSEFDIRNTWLSAIFWVVTKQHLMIWYVGVLFQRRSQWNFVIMFLLLMNGQPSNLYFKLYYVCIVYSNAQCSLLLQELFWNVHAMGSLPNSLHAQLISLFLPNGQLVHTLYGFSVVWFSLWPCMCCWLEHLLLIAPGYMIICTCIVNYSSSSYIGL